MIERQTLTRREPYRMGSLVFPNHPTRLKGAVPVHGPYASARKARRRARLKRLAKSALLIAMGFCLALIVTARGCV